MQLRLLFSLTQSVFVSQNKGISDPIDVIIQIENSNSGLAKVSTHAHHGKSNHCSLKESNSAVTKPKGIPSSRDIFKVINEDNSIIRELCLIYIQDYICLDYDLPPACHDLLDSEDGHPIASSSNFSSSVNLTLEQDQTTPLATAQIEGIRLPRIL